MAAKSARASTCAVVSAKRAAERRWSRMSESSGLTTIVGGRPASRSRRVAVK